MIRDRLYQEQLLQKLCSSTDLDRLRQLCNQLFGQTIFWIVKPENAQVTALLHKISPCPMLKGAKRRRCLKFLKQVVYSSRRLRKIKHFFCPAHSFGLCLPLLRGDTLYGLLILCHLKDTPTPQCLAFLEALNSEILEKIQQELELSKLYESIRPRAIALSTIHTIRRLISSSLNLEELLPRVARLSLQVLRAKRCVISLVDEKTKRLLPKAVIDLSKKKKRLRISPAMHNIENRVRRTGNILLKRFYLSVPLIDEETMGVITVWQRMDRKPFDVFDREILTALAEQAVGAIKNAQLYREQEETLLGTVKSLSSLLKVKSTYPYAHSKAFVDIVLGIARELKLSEQDLRNLRFAAMLHDAGELGIPEEILKKPAQLSGKELRIIKEHPKKSARILSPLQRLKPAIAIILHHHEKFNGTGYPSRLKGEAIPLGARIMAVADSFEAMISRRPYRKSASVMAALKEIKRQSGAQFDPRIINAFLKLAKKKSFKRLLKVKCLS